MQQIYRRSPAPKCDFNKVALQLCKPKDFWLKLLETGQYYLHFKERARTAEDNYRPVSNFSIF